MAQRITLTARLSPSAMDTRRGVVRLHPEVLDALGLRAWDAVRLTGARVSSALAAPGEPGAPSGTVLVDDVTLSNLGVTENAEIIVEPADVAPAGTVTVSGSRMARAGLGSETLRHALIGKVLTTGDAVSLLPQDLAPPPGANIPEARTKLAAAIPTGWTSELITITATEPRGVVSVRAATVVRWREDAAAAPAPEPIPTPAGTGTGQQATVTTPEWESDEPEPPPIDDLVGAREAAATLREWLDLAITQPELLTKLGTTARLGVLIAGPDGVGKTTMARAVAADYGARLVHLPAPTVAALASDVATRRVGEVLSSAVSEAESGTPVVLLITDVDTLLPATNAPQVATLLLDALRIAIGTPGLAVLATTTHTGDTDPRLRETALLDRELTLSLPSAKQRGELLNVLLREVPCESDVDTSVVASRTPGFGAADLATLRREAAVRAAVRAHRDSAGTDPKVSMADLLGATETVRPISMSAQDTLATGGLTLDDVGDMSEVKQSLTEAALWPLRYPDSFARLGVAPPRGILLYGPPGCGKTFLVRALAGTGQLNVLSVKGAELMNKWVGESERAVREVFSRARQAAPTLVFLDEVDALAPKRGGGDSGVSDRVVAALLTELDGVEPLRNVVILGATNRPELVDPALLRPGRLERLVYVPPPDATARADILRAAARNTPLAGDVDLERVAEELDGYSAADCAALVRESALTAMRESLDATTVTAAHLSTARDTVRPSLDQEQLADLAAYAERRGR